MQLTEISRSCSRGYSVGKQTRPVSELVGVVTLSPVPGTRPQPRPESGFPCGTDVGSPKCSRRLQSGYGAANPTLIRSTRKVPSMKACLRERSSFTPHLKQCSSSPSHRASRSDFLGIYSLGNTGTQSRWKKFIFEARLGRHGPLQRQHPDTEHA
jgi:hypothetical protein